MYASLNALRQDAISSSSRDLQIGQLVLGQLMTTRQQQLATSVSVLARDFGFLDAAASDDAPTIGSALANHGRRVGAGLATYVDAEGTIVTSSHRFGGSGNGDRFPFESMLTEARDSASAVVEVDDRAYQLVVAPVRAPQLIGWVGIGFEVDDTLAAALKELTRLEVTFYSANADQQVLASTLPADYRPGLAEALPAGDNLTDAAQIDLLDHSYLSVTMPLGAGENGVRTLLQRSLDEALAAYYALFERLVIIFGVALAVAIPVTRLVSNSVTRPVTRLGEAAERIEHGRYDQPIEQRGTDEIGRLAKAFNDMQRGIAQRESKNLHQSLHDELTGLPNRASIRQSLRDSINRGREAAGAVLLIDIAGFKSINDAFGHAVGDQTLSRLAALLLEIAPSDTRCARYGSNSFMLLSTASDPERLAGAVCDALRDPLELGATRVRINVTIGISRFPAHGTAAEDLLRRAEVAMYAARSHGTEVAVYQPGDDETHLRRLRISHELAQALENRALEVWYQPKLGLSDRDCRYAEALVRWQHPGLGRISPAEFVPIAEQSGLTEALTRLVVHKTIEQIAAWNAAGKRIKVSINISALDLLDDSLAGALDSLLARTGVDPNQICLEITETAVMNQGAATQSVLEALQRTGVELSIDDFGTGYSSLAQLRRMPVSELKIDRAFVGELPDNREDMVIVRSVIELAHNMNLRVVAEGVESAECCRWLAAAGCEMAQGFAIGRPMTAEDFAVWGATFDPATLFDEKEPDRDETTDPTAALA